MSDQQEHVSYSYCLSIPLGKWELLWVAATASGNAVPDLILSNSNTSTSSGVVHATRIGMEGHAAGCFKLLCSNPFEGIRLAVGSANAYPDILTPFPIGDLQMNRWLVISALGLAVVGIRVPAAIDQQPDTDNARMKLVKQRHEVLKKRLDVLREQYLIGSCTLVALMDAREDYLLSALELAETREERIKILLDRFENLRSFEKQIAQRFANGTTNVADLHLATANRLSAEIDLLDARSGATPDSLPQGRD